MNETNRLITLVVNQNSADNALRADAELKFNELAGGNPSKIAHELIHCCGHESSFPTDLKQSCLLHLKRLVPKFWSMGFESFIGPPIDQETKAFIREKLISLATTSPSSKIRSGSAYVIVQIAAADFPDEWPDLLDSLYKRATENQNSIAVMGSLSVLNDLFDDLISENQFWEGGVGNTLITYIGFLLEQVHMSPEIKISALKLYLTVLNTLSSAEALESEERRLSVTSHIKFISQLLLSLTKESVSRRSVINSIELVQFELRSFLYQVFTKILGSFRKIFPCSESSALAHVITEDLCYTSRVFEEALVNDADILPSAKADGSDEPTRVISNHVTNLSDLLSVLQGSCNIAKSLGPASMERFVAALIVCSQYPRTTRQDYSDDFNAFVTYSTGLSSFTSPRDSIQEFLSELNDEDSQCVLEIIKSYALQSSARWVWTEALLCLYEGLFSNQETLSIEANLSVDSFLTNLTSPNLLGNAEGSHPLLIARVFLLIPKALEKFSSDTSIDYLCTRELKRIFDYLIYSTRSNEDLIRASALISVTLWRNIENFDLSKLGEGIQASIMNVCLSLAEESEEDTLPILLEAISVAISIDRKAVLAYEMEGQVSVVDLILRLSFKDPANVQVMIDSTDCLCALLVYVSSESFLQVCQKSVPYLIEIIKMANYQQLVEYSPQLYLSLDLLGYIVEAAPSHELPKEFFFYVFPVLKDLILKSNDDQILQNAGEVFNKLMQNSEGLFMGYTDPHTSESGLQILLAIASKFLSPDLSDCAAMSCGLIVTTLFERFQSCLDSHFFFQLLEATVRRVARATAVITIENLIMVFCRLVLNTSPPALIDALTSMEVEDTCGEVKSGLKTVLPIWFESFEVTRGAEKIQQNILALGKIFSLGDPRVESVKVDGDSIPYDGDLIITRSMAKSMPQKFTQISAPHKILKLLVSELRFQSQQPDPNDYVLDKPDSGDEEEGWEDMDGIGVPDYEKLKSYVDSDEEDTDETSNEGIRDTLIQFFKECVSKDLAGFRSYYELLDEDERSIISENVIFA